MSKAPSPKNLNVPCTSKLQSSVSTRLQILGLLNSMIRNASFNNSQIDGDQQKVRAGHQSRIATKSPSSGKKLLYTMLEVQIADYSQNQ